MENLQTIWFELLCDALAAAGVRDVVLSPGSRSTPLVLALSGDDRLRIHDVIDERAAAFYALGQARVTGRASVCVCTSGTAGAHYLPAVVEAAETQVPLVLITADRPAELHGCGANQTVEQLGFFRGYAKMVVDLGAPDAAGLRGLRRIVAQAVAASSGGPVHLNARARKPLEPVVLDNELAARAARLKAEPLTTFFAPRLVPDPAAIDELARACSRARRGLVVAGPAPLAQRTDREAVRRFCAARGFVLAAEATSQLGGAPLDWLFRDDRLAPDLVVQLGAAPTSGAWERFVAAHPELPRFVVAPAGWPDPTSTARAVIQAPIAATLAPLTVPREPSPYLEAWNAERARIETVVARELADEGAVVREVVAGLPAGSLLVVGNSLVVRHLDNYATFRDDVGVLSQRGVSGIDGLVAGAAGAASVAGGPVTLLLGDVSLLHDVSSLALAARHENLSLVVIDNGGGRIFEQLPVAKAGRADALPHFTTPHGLPLQRIADAFGATRFRHAICAPHGAAATRARILAELAR